MSLDLLPKRFPRQRHFLFFSFDRFTAPHSGRLFRTCRTTGKTPVIPLRETCLSSGQWTNATTQKNVISWINLPAWQAGKFTYT